jgi:hypothetical protein
VIVSTYIKTPIIGKYRVTSEQMYQFARSINPSFPRELSGLYLEIGAIYSVRGDIAFAQMIKETGYHRFRGDVSTNQYNYAGIGAVGGGIRGATFENPREGVTAHIQHLYAYASNQPLPAGEVLVDPRFHYVTRGIAPHWEDLNGRWAVPGVNYGQEIVAIYRRIVETQDTVQQPNSSLPSLPTPANPTSPTAPGPSEPSPEKEDPTPSVPNTVPVWARPTIQKLLDKGMLHNPEGDETFYRVLVIMDRLNKLE